MPRDLPTGTVTFLFTVFAAAELAILAAERRDHERAGRLWGAVESEVHDGAVGQWEDRHEELENLVLRADRPLSVKRAPRAG